MDCILNNQDILLSSESDEHVMYCVNKLINGLLSSKEEYDLNCTFFSLNRTLQKCKTNGNLSIQMCFGLLRYGKLLNTVKDHLKPKQKFDIDGAYEFLQELEKLEFQNIQFVN